MNNDQHAIQANENLSNIFNRISRQQIKIPPIEILFKKSFNKEFSMYLYSLFIKNPTDINSKIIGNLYNVLPKSQFVCILNNEFDRKKFLIQATMANSENFSTKQTK